MDDMAELLDSHELVDLDGQWLAHPVDIVSSKVYQHDMFCSILR